MNPTPAVFPVTGTLTQPKGENSAQVVLFPSKLKHGKPLSLSLEMKKSISNPQPPRTEMYETVSLALIYRALCSCFFCSVFSWSKIS